MFESLSSRLQEIISNTSSQKTLTDENMQDAFREIRRAFLEADVSLKVVKAYEGYHFPLILMHPM